MASKKTRQFHRVMDDNNIVDLWQVAADNVQSYDDKLEWEKTHPLDAALATAPVSQNVLGSSAATIFTSYVIPTSVWQLYPSKKMRENWVTLRIPPTVDPGRLWHKFSPPRMAYVLEFPESTRGVGGPFSVTHWGRSNFNISWCIAKPIDPSLYNYLNETLGESESRFAVLGRNTYWLSAIIGGFDPDGRNLGENFDGPHFYVHYNDSEIYTAVVLPLEKVIEMVNNDAPRGLLVAEYGEDAPEVQAATGVGKFEPVTIDTIVPQDTDATVGETLPLKAADTTPGTDTKEPLINATFYAVDMARFWPQFFMALDIALPFYSRVGSTTLLNVLRNQSHWLLLKTYMEQHAGKFEYVPPRYKHHTQVGNYERPDYS